MDNATKRKILQEFRQEGLPSSTINEYLYDLLMDEEIKKDFEEGEDKSNA